MDSPGISESEVSCASTSIKDLRCGSAFRSKRQGAWVRQVVWLCFSCGAAKKNTKSKSGFTYDFCLFYQNIYIY
jgi:hypothetical protein